MPSVTSSYFKYGVVQGNVRGEGEWEGEWKGGVAWYTPLWSYHVILEGHISMFQNNMGSVLWKKQQRTSKLENQHSMQSKVAYNIIHRKFKPYQLLLSFMSPAMSLWLLWSLCTASNDGTVCSPWMVTHPCVDWMHPISGARSQWLNLPLLPGSFPPMHALRGNETGYLPRD